MKDLKIISLKYYLNNNLITYKKIYIEFSQIATRISFKCQIHITILNNKYNT